MRRKNGALGRFIHELGRRHVGRVAIAYAAVVFVLLQAGEIVLPAFDAPEWVLRLLVVMALLGFPVALVLAWVYDVTPQGIRRTRELEASPADRSGRFWPRVALLVVTLVAVSGAGWWMIRHTVPEEARLGARGASRETASAPGVSTADEAGPIRSIAVLPFEDFSEGGEPSYFSAGMHEAVVAELGRISTLRVVSRTSVMRYAGTTMSVPEIADELNVDALVEGSVLRADDRVRITVQLIDARSDRHIWTNSYERQLADVISLQNEVARAIVGEIEAELLPTEETRLADATPVDPEAHDAYLRGRFEQSKGTPEALEEAARHYEEAVRADSSYTPAYTGLATSRLLLGLSEPGKSDSLLSEAAEAARHAVVSGHSSPEAQAVLSEIQQHLATRRDSLAGVARSLVVNIDSLVIPGGEWLGALAEFGLQMEEVGSGAGVRVRLAPDWHVGIARRLADSGQYDPAVEMLRGILEGDPSSGYAWDALEHTLVLRGDLDGLVDALEERSQQEGAGGPDRTALQRLRDLLRERGARGYWEWKLARLNAAAESGRQVSYYDYAAAQISLGREDAALGSLRKAVQTRDPKLVFLRGDPTWDPLRGEPAFRQIVVGLRRVVLTEPPRPNQPR